MQGNILVTFSLASLLTSMIAVEMRNLRVTVIFYFFHSIFLCSIIVSYAYLMHNPTLYLWSVTCFITKVLIIPTLLWKFVQRVPSREYRPVIGFGASMFILSVIVMAFFTLFRTYLYLLAPTHVATVEPVRSLLAVAFTIFMVGVYTLLTRRDAIKTVIGLALLENGVHLVLLALVPNLAETTMIGILTNVVVVVGLLLYLSTTIYEVFGTTDTAQLSELKR